MKRCGKCTAPRPDDICHKCGSETFEPCEGWEEPRIPPIDEIRMLARDVGYALAVHGTLERDVDLIACPWVDGAVSQIELLNYISTCLPARIVETEPKPLGRMAATLQMDGWFKPIDISISPMTDE